MRVGAQPAYVLHARAWRETSLLLEAFTRDFGRVGLVARGVRGARARLPRSALEPLQRLRLDWTGRGELQTLTAAEPEGAPHAFRGDTLLSAMYANELLMRLTARNDPHPHLFDRYAELLDDVANAPSLGWHLRCFERDLLAAIGYALRLETAAGTDEPIDAARIYDYFPEEGAVDTHGQQAGSQPGSVRVRGSALLALSSGKLPDAEGRAALRRLMRMVIGTHVGERGLQSWRVLAGTLRQG